MFGGRGIFQISDMYIQLLISALPTLINHQYESPIPSGAQGGTFKYRTDVPCISRRNWYFGLVFLSLFTTKKGLIPTAD